MPNENCLQGIRCPKCGQEEHFHIEARVTCFVTDDGAEARDDTDWNDDSHCSCPQCQESGPLKRFRIRLHLPPDPEGMNDKRAAWAGKALSAFIDATGTDREDALPDLLADLMHWCDRSGTAFDAQLERARWHYEAETGGEDSTS